jgi:hypothetical protein
MLEQERKKETRIYSFCPILILIPILIFSNGLPFDSATLILTIQALKKKNKRNIRNYKARTKDPNLGDYYYTSGHLRNIHREMVLAQ